MKVAWNLFPTTIILLAIFTGPTAAIEQSKAYWIWNGNIQETVLDADTLYVFQGIFDLRNSRPYYRFQGVIPHPLPEFSPSVVPTYRLNRLVPPEMVTSRFIAHRRAWERRGVRVVGMQIDYDCPTFRLSEYADWLAQLKISIGEGVSLSITGLGDWLTSAREGDLIHLAGQVGFIAFMMYHSDRPLHRLEQYTKRLAKLSTPFFLGRLSSQSGASGFGNVRRAIGYQGDIVFPHSRGTKR